MVTHAPVSHACPCLNPAGLKAAFKKTGKGAEDLGEEEEADRMVEGVCLTRMYSAWGRLSKNKFFLKRSVASRKSQNNTGQESKNSVDAQRLHQETQRLGS